MPLPPSEWLSIGIHKPVLKTTLNVLFQKCASHRVVSGVRCSKCSKSSNEIQFLSCFIWHFINPLISVWRLIACWLETESGAGLFTQFRLLRWRTERKDLDLYLDQTLTALTVHPQQSPQQTTISPLHPPCTYFGYSSCLPPPPHCRATSPGETKLLASEVYEILQAAGKEEAEQAEAAAASCRRKAQFFLGSTNKRAKTVVLHIDGLDDSVTSAPSLSAPLPLCLSLSASLPLDSCSISLFLSLLQEVAYVV